MHVSLVRRAQQRKHDQQQQLVSALYLCEFTSIVVDSVLRLWTVASVVALEIKSLEMGRSSTYCSSDSLSNARPDRAVVSWYLWEDFPVERAKSMGELFLEASLGHLKRPYEHRNALCSELLATSSSLKDGNMHQRNLKSLNLGRSQLSS